MFKKFLSKSSSESTKIIQSNVTSKNKFVNNVKGFQWRRFENEPLKKIDSYNNQNDDSKIKVHEYDNSGKYLRTYNSIREANRNGIKQFAIHFWMLFFCWQGTDQH